MMLELMHKRPADKVSYSESDNVLKIWLFDYISCKPAGDALKISFGNSPEHHATEDASVV